MNTVPNQKSVILESVCQALPDPIFIIDEKGVYVEVMGGIERTLYDTPDYLRSKRLHDVFPKADADKFISTVKKAIDSDSLQIIEYVLTSVDMKFNPMDGPGNPQWYEGRVFPFRFSSRERPLVLWIAINITEKKSAQIEKDKVSAELKKALSEIKTLQGIIPICSNCRKIRDDEGFWHLVEKYLQEHTDAEFSHGICPECMDKIYGDEDWYKKEDFDK